MTHNLRNTAFYLALAGCLAITAGCNNTGSTESSSAGNTPAETASSTPPAAPHVGGSEAPAAAAEDPKLVALETKLKANPSDEATKKELAEATYQVGHTMMLNPELPPRVKYRGALKHFRRVLELDPKHAKAAEEKKTIEDIYQSMGMPIPQ